MLPLVSVVVASRNRPTLLRETLQSVLDQDLHDLEIIVCDDCSDQPLEGSLQADSRIRVIRNSQWLGVSTSRNRAIEIARGDYVAFLDDDDLWSPSKLSRQVAAMQQTGRTWAFCGSFNFRHQTGEVTWASTTPDAETAHHMMPTHNPVTGGNSNVIVRKDVLDQIGGFDAGLSQLADWEILIRINRSGPPAVIPDLLLGYRMHEGNMSLRPNETVKELYLLEKRVGHRVNRAGVFRWAGNNALRAGKRWFGVRAYGAAFLAGDWRSGLRAIITAVSPSLGVRLLRRPWTRPPQIDWFEQRGTAVYMPERKRERISA